MGAESLAIDSQGAGGRVTRWRAHVLWILVVLLVPAACHRGDPQEAPIRGAVSAVENRDAEGVLRHLSATYRDGQHESPAAAVQTLKRYVAGYERLKVTVSRLTIDGTGPTARARFRATLAGTPRNIPGLEGFLPRSSSYDFTVILTKEGDGWKIASASWAAAE